jgi:hypothetical protein
MAPPREHRQRRLASRVPSSGVRAIRGCRRSGRRGLRATTAPHFRLGRGCCTNSPQDPCDGPELVPRAARAPNASGPLCLRRSGCPRSASLRDSHHATRPRRRPPCVVPPVTCVGRERSTAMTPLLRAAVDSDCVLAAIGPAAVSRAGEQTAPSFLVPPVLVKSAGGAFVHGGAASAGSRSRARCAQASGEPAPGGHRLAVWPRGSGPTRAYCCDRLARRSFARSALSN